MFPDIDDENIARRINDVEEDSVLHIRSGVSFSADGIPYQPHPPARRECLSLPPCLYNRFILLVRYFCAKEKA